MKFTIIKTKSKSGKRDMYYPTVDGKRISHTNYGRKWEATNLLKKYKEHIGIN